MGEMRTDPPQAALRTLRMPVGTLDPPRALQRVMGAANAIAEGGSPPMAEASRGGDRALR